MIEQLLLNGAITELRYLLFLRRINQTRFFP